MSTTMLLAPESAPRWLRPLLHGLDRHAAETLPDPLVRQSARVRLMARRAAEEQAAAPPGAATDAEHRRAAVLILLGTADPDAVPEVVLQRRAAGVSYHRREVAFPGGGEEDGDAGPIDTALREAAEEVGITAQEVTPLALLPALFIPPSRYLVTPVLAAWRQPRPLEPVDLAETDAVARVGMDELGNADRQLQVRHPSGFVGPGYHARGLLIWGFTAALLTAVLETGGWGTFAPSGIGSDPVPLQEAIRLAAEEA